MFYAHEREITTTLSLSELKSYFLSNKKMNTFYSRSKYFLFCKKNLLQISDWLSKRWDF